MGVPWGKILPIAARVAGTVITGVPIAEAAASQWKAANGPDKAGLVLRAAQAELQAASITAGRDLSLNPAATAAIQRMIDAYVELHNVLAHQAIMGGAGAGTAAAGS